VISLKRNYAIILHGERLKRHDLVEFETL
jgi:hypothetical protein